MRKLIKYINLYSIFQQTMKKMIFIKMHLWIGYSKGFNQAKYNEECTVYSGVSKCFEVGANSGKAGGCDNRDCLSRANCYDQRSR